MATRYPMCFLTPSRLCSCTTGPSRGKAAAEAASARSVQNFMMSFVVKDGKVKGEKSEHCFVVEENTYGL